MSAFTPTTKTLDVYPRFNIDTVAFEPRPPAFTALPFPLHPVDLSPFSRKPSSHLVTPTDWFLDSFPVGPHLSEQTVQLAVSLEDVAHYDSKNVVTYESVIGL